MKTHYQQAVDLLLASEQAEPAFAALLVAQAQVHATLAVADNQYAITGGVR